MAFACDALVVLGVLLAVQSPGCWGSNYLAGDSYTYRLNNSDGSACMTVSVQAKIIVYYKSINDTTNTTSVEARFFQVPMNNGTKISGNCGKDSRVLSLTWSEDDTTRTNATNNSTASFYFSVMNSEWYLSQADFEFQVDEEQFVSPKNPGPRLYKTKIGQRLFNRTFSTNQYFYCKNSKKLWLLTKNSTVSDNDTGPCYRVLDGNKHITVCSKFILDSTMMFPGYLDTSSLKKKLCLEDFIDLQEIIIPAAVGGVLGVLLLVIFFAYLIAYIRRKRREGKYETINDDY